MVTPLCDTRSSYGYSIYPKMGTRKREVYPKMDVYLGRQEKAVRNYMGTQSAGAYLKQLRDMQRLSLDTVAKKLHTSKSQIDRVERGVLDTRSSLLLGYARLVGANIRYLIALLLDDPAVDDGTDPWTEFDQLTPKQRQAVIEMIRSMQRDE